MTAQAVQILDGFRSLPPTEQRAVYEAILREVPNLDSGRKRIADIAGKYRPLPDNGVSDHDRALTDAIAASKV